MIVKDIDQQSIDTVFGALWEQGKEEAKALGISLQEFKSGFEKTIKQSWSVAFYNGGECCAVACLIFQGGNQWRSLFAATDSIHKIWMPVTRYIRRATDYVAQEMDGIIELLTISEGPFEWYESIGFELTETDGNVDKYIKKKV